MMKRFICGVAAMLMTLWYFSFASAAEKPVASTEAVVTMIEGTANVFSERAAAGSNSRKGTSSREDRRSG